MPNPFEMAAERVSGGGDHRIEARTLVDAMTLEEKLDCLDGDLPFWPGLIDMSRGGYHRHTWPAAQVARMGVPGIRFSDGPRGCVVGQATAFPVSMARGASFDPALETEVGRAIGAELRASGATYTGAVCMNLLRHPAWGRAQETYGEDPHQVGAMAVAFTSGLQEHVMACMKHFALNSMENARFTVDVSCDERALHEVYLPHFRQVAGSGVASVMSAYNSVNGEWCGQNRTLLIDILRDEWGWDGFVTSDFIFGLRDPVRSVEAGLNIEMPFRQQRASGLKEAVERGDLAVADVDARVTETVATLLRFAFVFTEQPSPDVIACTDHRALARTVARRSIVLLHNDGLLPVDPATVRRVAVLGRLARVANLGDHGSSDVLPPETITPLAGLEEAFDEVVHHDTDAGIAAGADLVVVVVGLTADDEGEFIDDAESARLSAELFPPGDDPIVGLDAALELPEPVFADPRPSGDEPSNEDFTGSLGGDRTSLRLAESHVSLIREAVAANASTVVAVMGGSAVVMDWLEEPAASLMLWYPGMEGGRALADVLTGDSEPGGRLPFAVPHDESELPPFDRDAATETYGLLHGQWHLDATGVEAHLPFGHGLGYTTMAITDARVDIEDHAAGRAQATVENTGDRAGSTVVFVFASLPESIHTRPPRRLVGFARVDVDPGDKETVEIELDLDSLRIRSNGGWLFEPGNYRFTVGQQASDEARTFEVELAAP